MKTIYFLLIVIVFFLFTSCEKEILENEISAYEVEKDVVFNGEYLEFKSLEVFDSINKVLNGMEYSEFQIWEKGLGFESSRSIMNEFKTLKESVISDEEYNNLEQEFVHRLRFQEDGVVRF